MLSATAALVVKGMSGGRLGWLLLSGVADSSRQPRIQVIVVSVTRPLFSSDRPIYNTYYYDVTTKYQIHTFRAFGWFVSWRFAGLVLKECPVERQWASCRWSSQCRVSGGNNIGGPTNLWHYSPVIGGPTCHQIVGQLTSGDINFTLRMIKNYASGIVLRSKNMGRWPFSPTALLICVSSIEVSLHEQ